MYRPPDQVGFLTNLSSAISNSENFDNQEVYILGDLNLNLKYQGRQLPNGIREYREFCALHGLTQIIDTPTRVTKHSSTILDHILTNSEEKNSQSGVIDVALSDHQMIYCTRKTVKPKTHSKTYIKIRSLKHYSKELLLEKLAEIQFQDNSTHISIDEVLMNDSYSNLISKLSKVIDKIAPIKEICIKNNTEEWVNEEVFEGIRIRDKCFRKFKRMRLHIQFP